MVVAVVICHRTGILFFSRFDNFQLDHYSRTPTGSILDLTAIFWFPVDCNIHWQAMVDPMAALPIPPGHGLIDANFIRWKKFCARCSLKFLTKSSTTSLQRYCIRWTIGWLFTKPDAHPQVVEPLPWHPCKAKRWSRDIFVGGHIAPK